MLLYQEDAELLFPARLIPTLRDLRGEEFQQLVSRVEQCVSEVELQKLGFVLMMIRLSSCVTCTADSYRAMNGCTRCAQKTVRGFKGNDDELVNMWETACKDITIWRETGLPPKD